MRPAPIVRWLGMVDFQPTWDRMRALTAARDDSTPDEIWLLEHPPVFTLGMNGDTSHVLAPGDIPVIQIDRGGQVTYHGPGQLVVYPLLDLDRLGLGVRDLVTALENAVVSTLAGYDIEALARADAPGVYVDGRKIASIGLRVKRQRSYHGLAFNIALDLAPFSRINPCGFKGLELTQVSALGGPASLKLVGEALLDNLLPLLGYTTAAEGSDTVIASR